MSDTRIPGFHKCRKCQERKPHSRFSKCSKYRGYYNKPVCDDCSQRLQEWRQKPKPAYRRVLLGGVMRKIPEPSLPRIERVVSMREQGLTYEIIGERLGTSRQAISGIFWRLRRRAQHEAARTE